jgi:hypothetical protein
LPPPKKRRKLHIGLNFAVDIPAADNEISSVLMSPLGSAAHLFPSVHQSPSPTVTRASIQQAIEFRGLIEGCADHQWLLTDALYHSGEAPPDDDTSRWVIRSELVQAPSSAETNGFQNHFVARDREAGWTVTASSATDLAQRIRQQCTD